MDTVALTTLGIAALLAFVSLLPPLADRLAIPTTVLLAVLGCALGLAATFAADHLGFVGDALRRVGSLQIGAEAFLTIFLPILLFETALTLDTRALLKDMGPVLALAVLAVLVTTFIAGLALWAASGFALVVCLLLAAIVATTDPIAVIGIFRDVGAPQRLRALVENESLLNDAAAIALFNLFLGAVMRATEPDLAAGALNLSWKLFAGAAFGFVVGRLACVLMQVLRDIHAAEMTLSLAVPYLVFVVGERALGASGVVAVVTAGLVFGAFGRTRLAPAAWQATIAMWAQLSFWASSLVFVLASMLVPRTLSDIGWDEVGLLLVLATAALAARALILWLVLPVLSSIGLGERIEHGYKVVMLWGGLRGTVTLALALAVAENAAVEPADRHFVASLATGFVLFTLFVQAPTLRPLMRWLRLNRLVPADRSLRARALTLALDDIIRRLDAAARDHRFEADRARDLEQHYRERRARLDPAGLHAAGMPEHQLCLVAVAEQELALCRQQLDERMLSRRLSGVLTGEAIALLDALRDDGPSAYERAAEAQTDFGRSFRLALWLHRRCRFHRPLMRQLADRFELFLARAQILRRLQQFARACLTAMYGDEAVAAAEAMIGRRLSATERALKSLKLQYPDYGRMLEARYLKRAALRMEEDAYRQMASQSLISREVHQDLVRDLRARRRRLVRLPALDLELSVTALVRSVPLFDGLDEAGIRSLAALLRPHLALPGERLVQRGARGDRMFFIASGAVEVRPPTGSVELGSGDFFGEIALLTRQPRTADVFSLGYSRLLVLDGRDFRRFLRAHPALRAQIDRIARERLQRLAAGPAARHAAPAATAPHPADAGS